MNFGPVIPVLRSFDEARARAFYLDYLGFVVDWEHRFEPHLPLYMQVSRGGVALHLSEHHGDATPGAVVRIHVADLPSLARELADRPVNHNRPSLDRMPWGLDELRVTDPFGNRVVFYRPAAAATDQDN